MSKKARSSFSGKIGFVLAAAGSAVGLGNIWRFPYLAAKYGGGIFLLVYILLVVLFGCSMMIAEIAIGRKTGLSAIEAYKALDKRYAFIGIIASSAPIIILPYYSVIGGWVTKYLASYVAGGADSLAGTNFFSGFISKPIEPVIWFLIFITITFVVVIFGVEKGVEKASKIMMPILVVLSIIVAVYSITLPGAWEGVKYYLVPDFSRFSVNTVLGAMGQMFYSMSLAMGIMITYGSYMKKDVRIDKSVTQIASFDTGIALISGLMVIPAVFVFSGGDASKIQAGPGLMFDTLPKVFEHMGMTTVVGIVFFLLVFFAALTSSISLMETVVSFVEDKLHWSRKPAAVFVYIGAIAIGLLSCFGFGIWSDFTIFGFSILDFFDFISNSVIMPIVSLMTCLFISFVVGTKTLTDEVELSGTFKRKRYFDIVIRYIAPVFILIVLVSSVLNATGVISI